MEPKIFDRNNGREYPTLDTVQTQVTNKKQSLGGDNPALQPDFSRVVLGGFLGTLLMTLVMYAGPAIGLPNLDLAGMLGALLIGSVPEIYSGPWWAGMVWHFINGSLLFPLIYAYLIMPGRSGTPTMKGVLWGLTLWTLAQAIVMPVMGGGFFSSNTMSPLGVIFGSLIAHLIYGATLGSTSRRVANEAVDWSRQHRASDRAA